MILRSAQLITFCLSTIVMIPAVQAGPIQDADAKAGYNQDSYVNLDQVFQNVESKADPKYVAGSAGSAFVFSNVADLEKSKTVLRGFGATPSFEERNAPVLLKVLKSKYVRGPLGALALAAAGYQIYVFLFQPPPPLFNPTLPLSEKDFQLLKKVSESKDNQ